MKAPRDNVQNEKEAKNTTSDRSFKRRIQEKEPVKEEEKEWLEVEVDGRQRHSSYLTVSPKEIPIVIYTKHCYGQAHQIS